MEELEYITILIERYVVFWFFHKLVTDIFLMKAASYHIIHDNFYFNFYMKTYFKYFNLNYPTAATK